MDTHRGLFGLVFVSVFGASSPHVHASNGGGDVVVQWNEVLQTSLAVSPLLTPRHYAMMHIAMFDAVNSIEQRYSPYRTTVDATPGASAVAAAAQAAHDVLVALLPDLADTFDDALDAQLEEIPPGSARQGVEAGREAAQAVLEWREDDGYADPNPEYVLPPLPGLWQPTAMDQVAAFVNFGDVEPFGLITATQFLPVRPPTLTSAEYAEDFQEVQQLGDVDSTVRTEEQTETALLHATLATSTNAFVAWNDVAQQFVEDETLSLVESARVFALLNASIHDGLQTSHSSKFVYGLWRPVTAIDMAEEDLNPDTTADSDWEPLLPTPPYPSHSSNLTCIGASAARALERLFDTDDTPFSVTWAAPLDDTGGDVTRSYDSFAALAEEAGRSRVYGGIHFDFELTASHESCRLVADYLLDNYATPVEE